MPSAKRAQRDATEDWEQLRIFVASPQQETYELLRPHPHAGTRLFGRTPAERARATGVAERTLRRKADRFDATGMARLVETTAPATHDRRALPAEVRQAILDVKAEYAPLRPNAIATICAQRFHRPVSQHTVRRVLAAGVPPTTAARRFPRYRDIADPVERRLAVVRLYLEGWNVTSIAGYLATKRDRVYAALRRWFAEGLPGLEDQSRAPQHPARKVDLKALAAIRRLRANPAPGGFRVSAALEQRDIFLSPRTCRRILALHRDLGAASRPPAAPREPRPHPFAATRRHQIWSVDIRYIEDHGLDTTKPVYVIAVPENHSRALLASLLSPRQDLTAYLVVLRDALQRFGAPEIPVSDSRGVFLAKQAQRIYRALGIEKREIARGRPWPGALWAHTSRPTSGRCAGWPTITSPRPRAGRRCTRPTRASSTTTPTRSTSPTRTVPSASRARRRSCGSCMVPGATRPISTASSASGRTGASPPGATSGSGIGACTASGGSRAPRRPSGSSATTSPSSTRPTRSPGTASPTSRTTGTSATSPLRASSRHAIRRPGRFSGRCACRATRRGGHTRLRLTRHRCSC